MSGAAGRAAPCAHYTVLIVPEHAAHVRRLKVPQRWLTRLALGAVALCTCATFLLAHYVVAVRAAAGNGALKEENVWLKARLRGVEDEVALIDASLQRIDRFATRVRTITALHDPARALAMGPLQPGPAGLLPGVLHGAGERQEHADEALDSRLALRIIDANLEGMHGQAQRADEAMRAVHGYFADQGGLLATTPSIRPTRSRLLTSAFGPRIDPYTDRKVMHKGVDFAAEHGAEVIAPADGVVIFAGSRGSGYGRTLVVDHGFGVQTHYAHLSRFSVEIGESVRRGQQIAAVGNTGRTTGAHLHYEVRFNGIPEDPEKFILD